MELETKRITVYKPNDEIQEMLISPLTTIAEMKKELHTQGTLQLKNSKKSKSIKLYEETCLWECDDIQELILQCPRIQIYVDGNENQKYSLHYDYYHTIGDLKKRLAIQLGRCPTTKQQQQWYYGSLNNPCSYKFEEIWDQTYVDMRANKENRTIWCYFTHDVLVNEYTIPCVSNITTIAELQKQYYKLKQLECSVCNQNVRINLLLGSSSYGSGGSCGSCSCASYQMDYQQLYNTEQEEVEIIDKTIRITNQLSFKSYRLCDVTLLYSCISNQSYDSIIYPKLHEQTPIVDILEPYKNRGLQFMVIGIEDLKMNEIDGLSPEFRLSHLLQTPTTKLQFIVFGHSMNIYMQHETTPILTVHMDKQINGLALKKYIANCFKITRIEILELYLHGTAIRIKNEMILNDTLQIDGIDIKCGSSHKNGMAGGDANGGANEEEENDLKPIEIVIHFLHRSSFCLKVEMDGTQTIEYLYTYLQWQFGLQQQHVYNLETNHPGYLEYASKNQDKNRKLWKECDHKIWNWLQQLYLTTSLQCLSINNQLVLYTNQLRLGWSEKLSEYLYLRIQYDETCRISCQPQLLKITDLKTTLPPLLKQIQTIKHIRAKLCCFSTNEMHQLDPFKNYTLSIEKIEPRKLFGGDNILKICKPTKFRITIGSQTHEIYCIVNYKTTILNLMGMMETQHKIEKIEQAHYEIWCYNEIGTVLSKTGDVKLYTILPQMKVVKMEEDEYAMILQLELKQEFIEFAIRTNAQHLPTNLSLINPTRHHSKHFSISIHSTMVDLKEKIKGLFPQITIVAIRGVSITKQQDDMDRIEISESNTMDTVQSMLPLFEHYTVVIDARGTSDSPLVDEMIDPFTTSSVSSIKRSFHQMQQEDSNKNSSVNKRLKM